MFSAYTVRWGVLATGGIAETFTKDLLLDPSTRRVSDVKHAVTAAASSSSVDRAKRFFTDCKCPSDASAYGSYSELVNDPNVDIVYVATPHSHHYQNAMLCLLAGKHVLCEKAFTTNAAQAKKLVETASEQKLFLMEALWTRFFPMSVQILKMIEGGELGDVHRVIADNSFGEKIEEVWGTQHRMVNMDLAGGGLLDQRKPPSVLASISKYAKTGVDEKTSMLLTFPAAPPATSKHEAHGIALTNFRVATFPNKHEMLRPAIRIQRTKGEIQVDGPAYRPRNWRFIPVGDEKVDWVEAKIPGHGMFWEADECARCLRDGRLESETIGWEESIVIMETMDEVRRQNGLKYPVNIETVDLPRQLVGEKT